VEGLVAERVERLAPGVALNFSVFGTEQALVRLSIEGVSRSVPMREVQSGIYEGNHVIEVGDAVRADSRVVATMERGGRVARAALGEPLLFAAMPLPWDGVAAPGGAGSSDAPSGDLAAQRPDAAPLRPIAVSARTMATWARPIASGPTRCADCATVESIRVVEATERDGLAGKLRGAFTDHRRRVLGVLGAIGVPFAARESERLAERPMEYEVVLRLPDGRAVARRYGSEPGFRVGDVVSPPADERGVASAGS